MGLRKERLVPVSSPFSPEARSYQRGYEDAERRQRIRTFAALRRAAHVAREYDRLANMASQHDPNAIVSLVAAGSARRAIRSALLP